MVLLPYQQRWMADESPVKWMEKSRRIGLSWTEAGDDALLSARKNGMDVWYIGYNKDMAQEFIEDASDWARFYNKAATTIEEFLFKDEEKDIQAFRIRFASGHKIVALSSRPANLRGKQGKIVIDEAAFHDDLPGLLKAAIAMLMWGGRVVVISTHDGDDNPFNEAIQDILAGKKPYSHHKVTLDDAIKEGLYERICLRLGKEWAPEGEEQWRADLVESYGDDAEEELFCIPSQGSGLYLPRVWIEAIMDPDIPVLRWSCKDEFATFSDGIREKTTAEWISDHLEPALALMAPTYPCYFGEDFGRTGDLTIIFPLQEKPGLNYRAPFLIELRNVPFEQQKQILFHTVDSFPDFRGGALDERGNGQYLAEVAMQRYGQQMIHQIALSQSWYIANMPPFKSAVSDRSMIIPRDGDILDDFRAIKMQKGVAKVPEQYRRKGRDGGQRHGDAAIAACLAWYAATKIDAAVMPEVHSSKVPMARQHTAYHSGINYGAYR